MKIHTLGTSHGATEKGRSCSINLFEVNGSYYLFDCGGAVEEKMTDADLPIKSIKAIFVSHMHADHICSIPAIAKRFTVYIGDRSLNIFLPEQSGITALRSWLTAMHLPRINELLSFEIVNEGKVFEDENIKVTAIATKHIDNGRYPSYAYIIEAEGKRVLYTGDLSCNFIDYPTVLFEQDFDTVLSELVHFNVEENADLLSKTRTNRVIFTHLGLYNLPKLKNVISSFPFEVIVADDGMCFEV